MRVKTSIKVIISCVLIVFFSVNHVLFAGNALPRQVNREKKKFIEYQITPANKLFLDRLSSSFSCLNETNVYASQVLDFLPAINKSTYPDFVSTFQSKVNRILRELTLPDKPGQNIREFIGEYLGEKNNLGFDINQLLKSYEEIKNLDINFKNSFTEDLPTSGVYHYYTLCLKGLEYPPSAILDQMINACADSAEACQDHDIKRLKSILPEVILSLEKSNKALEDNLVERIKHSQVNWGRSMIIQIIKLIQQQMILNQDFLSSVSDKLNSIPTPDDPELPDLQVILIGMSSVETIAVGRNLTIIVVIKNVGNLSVRSSKAKITFPNGKAKIFRVPGLNGGQTYLKTLRYKVNRLGKNEFAVMANFNFRTWESNTFNNLTKRALILQ